MKLPEADWQKSRDLDRLLNTLAAAEGETRFVGGCVRDTLLGLAVSDVDLATRLRPEQVLERLEAARIKSVRTNGIAHGTVTAVIAGRPIEITTLRRDVATDGRRATIAYTDDWAEDAARRDFTINALSADPVRLKVHDYFGGLDDLEARLVRFIGDPLIRIAEDHLRILRFFRFHARFGRGAPDEAALAACIARANDLMALSRERIADELLKLLSLPEPVEAVRLMVDHAILRPFLPEATEVAALERLVDAERMAGVAPAAIRRLAALLPPDPAVAADVAARLRLSKKAAKRLASAADRTIASPQRLAFRIGTESAIDRLLLAGESGEEVAALASWQPPRLPISGGDLIAMGLVAGPLVARTLRDVEREWEGAGFPADREAVRAIARAAIDQALRANQ